MWILFLAFTSGVVASLCWFKEPPGNKDSKPLAQLKNALLTLALMRTNKDKIDGVPTYRYDKHDGTSLPALSGCDLANACFSYIIDKAEFRKDPFYTKTMEDKLDAINLYLAKNLGTREQVETFFDKYTQK